MLQESIGAKGDGGSGLTLRCYLDKGMARAALAVRTRAWIITGISL